MRRCSTPTAVVILTGALAVAAGSAEAQSPPQAASPCPPAGTCLEPPALTLVKPPLLVVDGSGNASAVLTLKSNVDKKTLALDVSDFSMERATGGEYLLGTRRSLTGATERDRQVLDGKQPLAKEQAINVKLDVANFWNLGEGKASVWDGKTRIAEISAVRAQAPFNVQIASATPDNPELHLITRWDSQAGHFVNRGAIALKNTDPVTYRVTWRLRCDNGCAESSGTAPIELPPNSVRTIDLAAPVSWWTLFTAWLGTGSLKDDVTPGALELNLVHSGATLTQALPSKWLTLAMRTSFWRSPWQQAWNLSFLCLLLFIGGTFSLLAHHAIPNTTRALGLRRRLKIAEHRLEQLGGRLDSRWRVLLQSRCDEIDGELDNALWIFPDFATTLDRLTATTTAVEQWTEVVADVVLVLDRANTAVRDRIPPTLLIWTERCCAKALAPLEHGTVSPEQLQETKALVRQAQQWLDSRDAPNPDLEKVIMARETRLKPRVPQLIAASGSTFGGLLKAFDDLAGSPLSPTDYADRDALSLRVELLNEYVELLARATGTPAPPPPAAQPVSQQPAAQPVAQPASEDDALSRLKKGGEILFPYVTAETYESLRQARIFVEQMRQDIYATALQGELGPPPRLAIVVQSGRVQAGVPVYFTLRFHRSILNQAAATQEWEYTWDFGDQQRTEEGWSVRHTFKESKAKPGYTVKVVMRDLNGKPVDRGSVELDLPVEASTSPASSHRLPVDPSARLPWRERSRLGRALALSLGPPENRLELGRLLFALAIAVFALLTTARQQIQTLSLIEAAGAAVALGFGADTIKNLLTQKT